MFFDNFTATSTLHCIHNMFQVQPRTNAHKAGLQEGDQILFANNESFLNIDSQEVSFRPREYATG